MAPRIGIHACCWFIQKNQLETEVGSRGIKNLAEWYEVGEGGYIEDHKSTTECETKKGSKKKKWD